MATTWSASQRPGPRLRFPSVQRVDAWLALVVLTVQFAAAVGIASHHPGNHISWGPLPLLLLLAGPAALLLRSTYPGVPLAVALAAALINGALGYGEGPLSRRSSSRSSPYWPLAGDWREWPPSPSGTWGSSGSCHSWVRGTSHLSAAAWDWRRGC